MIRFTSIPKVFLVSILLAFTLFPSLAARRPEGQYRVMTCNIRITGLEADDPYPERVWENRKDLCIKTIRDEKPDFFCLQEVIYDSYQYFVEKFGKDYYYYGFVGPEMDPWTDGYHFIGKNVIFFRKDRFELVGSGCYWLSDEPLIGGSMSWGTNRARHCNWVRLRDRKTGRDLRILDTHLDHKSDSARREQMKIIVRECAQYDNAFPQILCGDFNADASSAPIIYIHAQDGWAEMYEDMHNGDASEPTFHNFRGPEHRGRHIDFIFHRGNVHTLTCDIVKDHEGKMYPSDHYFLDATYAIE